LAIVVVGGFTLAPALILLVLPLLILLFSPKGRERHASAEIQPEAAE
jgi:Cu/Ag efflux pump CusA